MSDRNKSAIAAVRASSSSYVPHDRVSISDWGESLTQQHFKDECDVNHIMKKYEKTGLLGHVNRYQGRYEDVSTALDLQGSLQLVQDAEEMFSSLPSAVRRRFDNDPVEFLAWVEDPANIDEVKEMGLGRPEELPIAVSVSEPLTAAPEAKPEASETPEQ